jgi:hypothetical protein
MGGGETDSLGKMQQQSEQVDGEGGVQDVEMTRVRTRDVTA